MFPVLNNTNPINRLIGIKAAELSNAQIMLRYTAALAQDSPRLRIKSIAGPKAISASSAWLATSLFSLEWSLIMKAYRTSSLIIIRDGIQHRLQHLRQRKIVLIGNSAAIFIFGDVLDNRPIQPFAFDAHSPPVGGHIHKITLRFIALHRVDSYAKGS